MIQKFDGVTVYDAFELSFNPIDKTSILKLNNVNISQTIINNSSNTYTKSEINNIISFLIIKMYHKLHIQQ